MPICSLTLAVAVAIPTLTDEPPLVCDRLPQASAFAAVRAQADSVVGPEGAQPREVVPSQEPVNQDRSLRLSWEKGLESDWRETLEKRGIRFNLYLNDQFQSVTKGGLDTNGSGRNSASLDTFVVLDFGRLGWITDADALLHLQSNWGEGVNKRVGSLSDVNDDADGDLGLHIAQLWYRQRFLNGRVALALGFLDFQSIVDRNAFANSEDKQFWNQSLDNNPFIPLAIGLGLWAEIQTTRFTTLNLGVADAQSVLYKTGFSTAFHEEDWFLAYAENTLKVELSTKSGGLAGNYRVGVVYDPRPRDEFTEPQRVVETRGHDYGWYVSIDQKLYRESANDDQGLGVFGRFGYRAPETNRTNRFWSVGLSYTGMISRRDADVLGLGFSVQRPSEEYTMLVDPEFDCELVYELYYAIQVSPWLVITPDLQYVENAGGSNDERPAVVAGVRFRSSF